MVVKAKPCAQILAQESGIYVMLYAAMLKDGMTKEQITREYVATGKTRIWWDKNKKPFYRYVKEMVYHNLLL